jgi:hypothetical protein
VGVKTELSRSNCQIAKRKGEKKMKAGWGGTQFLRSLKRRA